MSARRVYVVDDDAAVRNELVQLLGLCGFDAAAFENGEAFLERASSLEEGCVLLDLRMPGRSGLEVQQELVRRGLDFVVIFLTGHGDVPTSVLAVRGGALDFLEKPTPEEALLGALGRGFDQLAGSAGHRSAVRAFRQRAASLTPREREVTELVVQGMSNAQIGRRLGISLPTVKVHRMRAMAKLGGESLAQVVRLWGAMSPADSGDGG